MKKLLLLTSLFAIAFVGCKKKKKTNPSDATTIVGKWQVDKIESFDYKKGGELLNKETTVFDPVSYFEFKSNRSFNYHIKEVGEDDSEDESGSYTLSGKELTLVFKDGSSESFEIKTLNKTTLTFGRTEDEYEEDGVIHYGEEIFYLTK